MANKTRSRPIWKRTADMLKPLVAGRSTEEFVFLNRRDESRTRFGIYSLVRRDDDQASRDAAIAAKRINFRSDEVGIMLFRGIDLSAWAGVFLPWIGQVQRFNTASKTVSAHGFD